MNTNRITLPDRWRRLARPSTAMRAVWLSVGLLHGWLVLKYAVAGDGLTLMELVKGTLCLAAVGYALLKLWRVATIFDDAPRRAVAFALLLALLHWGIAVPTNAANADPLSHSAHLPALMVMLPAVALALGILSLDSVGGRRRVQRTRRPASLWSALSTSGELVPVYLTYPPLKRRPPPRSI